MALPAVSPPPFDVWIELHDVDEDCRTTTSADSAAPGVELAVGATVLAGDHEGNRVLATVTSLTTEGRSVDLRLHMESFVPAPRATKGKP